MGGGATGGNEVGIGSRGGLAGVASTSMMHSSSTSLVHNIKTDQQGKNIGVVLQKLGSSGKTIVSQIRYFYDVTVMVWYGMGGRWATHLKPI